MKRVIIISYFFPPCSLTAAQRTYTWAKHLHQHGYHPIVITRGWDQLIKTQQEISLPSPNSEEVHETHDGYEVHYMPSSSSVRDRIYSKYGEKRSVFRRLLTLAELILQNFNLSATPFANFYEKVEELVQQNPGINKVIISENPFASFYIGYKLKQRFNNLRWIADYRDDWNTSELNKNGGLLKSLVHSLEQNSEKKWVGSASHITSISKHYVTKISNFVGVKGTEIINGFTEKNSAISMRPNDPSIYNITYSGTLYPSQDIIPFLNAFKKLVREYEETTHLQLNLPGLNYIKSQGNLVRNHLKNYEDHFTLTDRIPAKEVHELLSNSNLLLIISHKGLKGISSSKLYDYLPYNRQVLLFPDDQDIMSSTLQRTGQGLVCNNEDEITNCLNNLIHEYITDGTIKVVGDVAEINKFARINQVGKLASILDNI